MVLPLHRSLIALLLLLGPAAASADPPGDMLAEEVDFEDIFSDIPSLDLNSVSPDDLAGLPLFTPSGAASAAAYLDSAFFRGEPPDADAIPGLTPIERSLLEQLLPPQSASRGMRASFRSGMRHLPGRENPGDSRYYFRLSAETGNAFRMTLTGDRDPFEPRALDHISGSLSYSPDSRTAVLLGDFRPGFGQHLLFSRYGRNYAGGGTAFFPDSRAVENTSREESGYLRGAYIGLTRGWLAFGGWTSLRKLDATLDADGNVLTIRTAGIHTGDAPRNNLSETLHAARIAVETSRWRLGIIGSTARYDPEFAEGTDERTFLNRSGPRFNAVSVSSDLAIGDGRLFFEHVAQSGREHATIAGVQTGRGRLRASIAARDYSAAYWASRAAGISAFGQTGNERGAYAGAEFDAGRVLVTAWFDAARTISRTWTVPMPRSRTQTAFQARMRFGGSLEGAASVRSSREYGGDPGRATVKLQVEQSFPQTILSRVRYLVSGTEGGGDRGYYGECAFYSKETLFDASLSVAGFAIPSYDARYYRYEQDVPGQGLTRPVWGDGWSFIAVGGAGPLSVRYRFMDSDLSGVIREIAMQADLRF